MEALGAAGDWFRQARIGVCLVFFMWLTACGGGGGGSASSAASEPPPAAPSPTLTLGMKEVRLSWPAVSGATSYQLLESPDGTSPFVPVGEAFTDTSVKHSIALYQRVNASYKVQACNAGGCTESAVKGLTSSLAEAIGYFKGSNSKVGRFGESAALSADGTTLAVGASSEFSSAIGINGDPTGSTTVSSSGAVYVFLKNNGTWSQQAFIKASNPGDSDAFGSAIALSADGNTLAVGANKEDSVATGINGNQADNSASDSGAVYVFSRQNGNWIQQAYVKASNTPMGADQLFGNSVALSSDGDILAVGAPRESSLATGVNGNQNNSGATFSGAVYVFVRSGSAWSQQAYIKASNTQASDSFGYSVALSSDGSTLAVGANGEDSSSTGINGDQANNGASDSGAVYVFVRAGSAWSQQAYLKASNTSADARFGDSVALSADGSTLAVGASLENSSATGINGDSSNNTSTYSGAVYVFTRSGGVWSQQAYIKASNTGAGDEFGASISLSSDGNTLAVSAYGEDSSATTLNGEQSSNAASASGAAYVFTRSGVNWTQQAYVKATNTQASDAFGSSVAMSGDGKTLAVGAVGEDSYSTGIGGDQNDDQSNSQKGAVYLY
ncbi:FG-GAP repeat-containing protein [Noviherbaspirillum humi]|uniref:FG-GAP repeat-containing protein n=2 Tax=Noviherbaspirillum humi TaxID=1688639 RepID=A0A239KN20_9BURK|nr:FG-GAP repeat-containing protein [Noviherbaspirillum humi]